MKTRRIIEGSFWIILYLVLTLAPVFVLLLGPIPAGRELWRDFSVAIAYCGLAIWMLQFILTARFKVIKAPFGSDIVYYFHKQISIFSLLLVLLHPLLLFIFSPVLLNLLNIFSAPLRAKAGVLGLLAIIVMVVLSIWRQRLRIEYSTWRIWHGILAVTGVALSFAHVYLVGYYLNAPWKQALWLVYSIFWVGLLFYIRLLKPWMLLNNPFRVVENRNEGGDIWTLIVEPVKGKSIRFQAGQFAWITVGSSPFSDAEHPFSISSSAENNATLSFSIKTLGDFTNSIKNIKVGQHVYVDAPFGSFSYERHENAKGFLFIAGGIGITPMLSMLRTMADKNEKRPVGLMFANKTWDATPFIYELEKLSKQLNLRIMHVIENPPVGWQGEIGFINTSMIQKMLPEKFEKNDIEVFICGPIPMMKAVELALSKAGVQMGDYHSERFDLV